MKDPIELLDQCIATMCELPDIFQNNPIDVAFSLGAIVTHLEYLRDQMKNCSNGDV